MLPEETLAYVYNLCGSDPDAGLNLIQEVIKENPELSSEPYIKWGKFLAFGKKGTQKLLEREKLNIDAADGDELLKYLNEEDLNYLDLALREINDINMADHNFISKLSSQDDKLGELKVDAMAAILDKCRPGRVQQILGKTKLFYWGVNRIKQMPYLKEKMSPDDLNPFLNIFFNYSSIVRSALILNYDVDAKGRKYIECSLFQKLLGDLGPTDSLADVILEGAIYLYDDGTFS